MEPPPIEALIFLLQDTIAMSKSGSKENASHVAFLEDFRMSRLIPIFHREKLALKKPFTLCLIGLTNVGKSTLIEALLDVPLAPRKNGPATAVPVEYSFDPRWTLEVHHHAASTKPVIAVFDDHKELASAVKRHVIDLSDRVAKKIALVCVKGPMKLLERDVVLSDTPGIGAAKIGSTVDDRTPPGRVQFLDRAGRIYLCVSAGVTWKVSSEEEEFFRSVSHLCSNVIVTKWEGTDGEQAEWRSTFETLFPGADFEFVNAVKSLNVARLQTIIQAQASREQRLLQVRKELLKAWKDLQNHFSIVFRAPFLWRADSLARFRSACAPFPELQSILLDVNDHGLDI